MTTGLSVANIVIGFGFQALIAAELGTSQLADSLQLAWAFVTLGAVVFLSLVPTLLVPRIQPVQGPVVAVGDAWSIGALGLTFSIIQLTCGLTGGTGDTTREILVWSSPAHLLAACAAVPQAVAYVDHRFGVAGVGSVANGLGLLASVAILAGGGLTPRDLGIGLTVGYAAQLLATVVPLVRRPPLHSRTRAVPLLAILGMVGFTVVTKSQPLLERLLAGATVEGATAAFGFGQKVAQGLLLLSSFGLAVNATASLSRSVNRNDDDAVAGLLARTTVSTVLVAGTALSLFLPVSALVTRILFVRGNFTADDADAVWRVILLQVPWVVACSVTGVLTSYLYVRRRYAPVLGASSAGLLMTWLAARFVTLVPDHLVVPLASSAGALTTLACAFVLVRRDAVAPHLRRALSAHRQVLLPGSAVLGLSTVLPLGVGLAGMRPASPPAVVVLAAPLALLLVLVFAWRSRLADIASPLRGSL